MYKVAVGIVFREGRKICDCTKRLSYVHCCPNQYVSAFESFLQRRCLQILMFLISNIVPKIAISVHFHRHSNSFFPITTTEMLRYCHQGPINSSFFLEAFQLKFQELMSWMEMKSSKSEKVKN